MWGTSRALQIDWTALVQEPWEGPNIATTPRASWSQAGGGREGSHQQSLGGLSVRQPWAQPCCLPWAGAVGRQTLLGTDPAPILGNYSSEEAQRERGGVMPGGSGPVGRGTEESQAPLKEQTKPSEKGQGVTGLAGSR